MRLFIYQQRSVASATAATEAKQFCLSPPLARFLLWRGRCPAWYHGPDGVEQIRIEVARRLDVGEQAVEVCADRGDRRGRIARLQRRQNLLVLDDGAGDA